jgi:transcriptional regulator with XRE-family HTH domain
VFYLEKDVGQRIKLLRTHLKINQGEFSEPLGIDRSHIAGIENGSRNPSEPLLRLICNIYCVNLTWLKTGQGEMFISPEDALKIMTARFGERTVMNALYNIMKEHGLTVANGRILHRPDTGDPDLDHMINTLCDLWASRNADMKGWIKVQFDRAFPKDIIEDAQKKQKESLGQASVS